MVNGYVFHPVQLQLSNLRLAPPSIKKVIINLEIVFKSGVMPVVNPTVPAAEIASNIASFAVKDCKAQIISVAVKTAKI